MPVKAKSPIINSFNKGMNRDIHPSLVDNDIYKYALNTVNTDVRYKYGMLSNERSTTKCVDIPEGYTVVGAGWVEERNGFILFSKTPQGNEIGFVDEIGCTYSKIVVDSEFGCNWNFSTTEWIEPVFKTIGPCNELNVYWSSGCFYYTINVDELCDPARRSDLDCDDFKLFTCKCGPTIDAYSMEAGGNGVRSGSYQFAVQLTDEDGNDTNWFEVSEPVSVKSPNNIAGEISGSSIRVRIDNLDTSYNKVKLAVGVTINQGRAWFFLDDLHYNSNGLVYMFTGLKGNEEAIQEAEIVAKKKAYIQGKKLFQKDGRLFLYQVKQEKQLNWQRQANTINTEYVTYRVAAKDAWRYKSLMRDEVYAFGIVFRYCDGTYSRVFHIPGRAGCPAPDCDCGNENTASRTGGPFCEDVYSLSSSSVASINYEPLKYETEIGIESPSASQGGGKGCSSGVCGAGGLDPAEDAAGGHDSTVEEIQGNVNQTSPSIEDSDAVQCEICKTQGCTECGEALKEGDNFINSGVSFLDQMTEDLTGNSVTSSNIVQASSNLIEAVQNQENKKPIQPKYSVGGEIRQDTSGTRGGASYRASSPRPNQNSSSENIEDLSNETNQHLNVAGVSNNCAPVDIYDEQGCAVVGQKLGTYSYGQCGQWCSTYLYPETKDCDGNFVYGDLAGTPIRHHRMPSTAIEPHFVSTANGVINQHDPSNDPYKETYVHLLGVRFSNIHLPSANDLPKPLCPTSPYKIVYVRRDDHNKSVVAKGIFTHTFSGRTNGPDGPEYAYPKHGVNSPEPVDRHINSDGEEGRLGTTHSRPIYNFHSPDTTYGRPVLSTDRATIDLNLYGQGWRHGLYSEGENPDDIDIPKISKRGARQTVILNHFTAPSSEGSKCITGITYAQGDRIIEAPQGIDLPLMNRFRESSVFLQLDQAVTLSENTSGQGGDVHSDGSFLMDTRDHPCPIHLASANYGGIKRYNASQYGGVEDLEYIDLGLVASSFDSVIEGYVGDTFINLYSFRRTSCVTDKVGPDVRPPRTELEYSAGYVDCTVLPKTGDQDDPRNENSRRRDYCWASRSASFPALGAFPDVWYPRVQSTLVHFWVETEVNLPLVQNGEKKNGEWVYEHINTHEIDSSIDGTNHNDTYLESIYEENRHPSVSQLLKRAAIRSIIDYVMPLVGAGAVASIEGGVDGVTTALSGVFGLAIWSVLKYFVATNEKLDKFLGLPVCMNDEEGAQENHNAKGWADNFNRYNYDHSIVNSVHAYLGIPDPFYTCDCDDCVYGEFTNEIYYSNKQNLKSTRDAYKNFKVNDYSVLPAHSGPIQDMFLRNQTLYLQTTDMLWVGQYSQPSLQTDGVSVFLGRGDLLAEPQEVNTDLQEGYMGTIDPNASVNCKYGYISIDREARAIYMMNSSGTEDLTRYGMSNFFKENLGLELTEAFPNYVCSDTKNGVGYNIGIDPRLDRILLTKIDFKPNPGVTYTGGNFFYNGKAVSLGDSEAFCNKSFTMSFDVNTKSWISFHSYIPQFYLWNRNHMFSVGNQAIWKHDPDVKSFQTFHGKYYPHIIEFPSRPKDTLDAYNLESVILGTQADELHDDIVKENIDMTFDYAAIYNTYQSTGTMTLKQRDLNNHLEAITQRNDVESIVRSKFDYRLNSLINVIPQGGDVVEASCNDFIYELNEGDEPKPEEDFFDKYFYHRYILDNPEYDNVQLFTKYVLSDHSYYVE